MNSTANTHKVALIFALVAAALVSLAVYMRAKPVALQSVPTKAATSVTLNWLLLEPEITVSTRIYRTTTGFLSDPVEQYKIAEVTAPTSTYQDTTGTVGVKYFYSIFPVDVDGLTFDASYDTLTPIIVNPPAETGVDINCSGTVYYLNTAGQKEGYPSAEIFFLWNSSFSHVRTYLQSQCESIPNGGLVYVPEGTLIKVKEGPTVWLVEGLTARPIASLEALYRISAAPRIIIVSIPYLHSHYSGGAIIQ